MGDVIRFNFNDAAKLNFRLDQCGADFVAHGMRGAVGAESHHPLNLECADTLFAGQHEVHDLEPLPQRSTDYALSAIVVVLPVIKIERDPDFTPEPGGRRRRLDRVTPW